MGHGPATGQMLAGMPAEMPENKPTNYGLRGLPPTTPMPMVSDYDQETYKAINDCRKKMASKEERFEEFMITLNFKIG